MRMRIEVYTGEGEPVTLQNIDKVQHDALMAMKLTSSMTPMTDAEIQKCLIPFGLVIR